MDMLMKYQNLGIMASVVFAVGMVGFNLSDGTFGTSETNDSSLSAMSSGFGIMGHIEAIQTDADGNIKSYIQTDNAITNRGVNCALTKVFAGSSGESSDICPDIATIDDTYNYITLSGSNMTDNHTLQANATNDQLTGDYAIASGSVTISQPATGTRSSTPQVTITNGFGPVTVADTVFGAGLTNSTGALFAYKDFTTSGGIALTNGDSLTVNWVIDLTGSTAENGS